MVQLIILLTLCILLLLLIASDKWVKVILAVFAISCGFGLFQTENTFYLLFLGFFLASILTITYAFFNKKLPQFERYTLIAFGLAAFIGDSLVFLSWQYGHEVYFFSPILILLIPVVVKRKHQPNNLIPLLLVFAATFILQLI